MEPKEFTCVDEVFAQDMLDEVSDDLMQDDIVGSILDMMEDDSDVGSLIDQLTKGDSRYE